MQAGRPYGFPRDRAEYCEQDQPDGFKAVFFLQCLSAIGCTVLWLEDS